MPASKRLILILLFTPFTLEAQIKGTVRTSDGNPVVAEVELWAPTQRLARRLVEGDGAFAFTATEANSATAIVFSQLGYKRVLRPLDRASDLIQIVLEPLPVEIEAVTALAARACPNRPDPGAENVLRRLRASYRLVPRTSFIEAAFAQVTTVVDAEEVGRFDERQPQYEIRGSLRSASSNLDILRDGYARPAGTRLVSGAEDSWEYAALGSLEADHFLSDHFAASHVLSLGETRTDGSFDVVYCPKQRKKPDVEGTLSLTRDTLLYEARWRFRVPRNEERASGTALFAPPQKGVVTHLLPLSSTFIRQHRIPGRYFQKLERYGIWATGEGSSPPRAAFEWVKKQRMPQR